MLEQSSPHFDCVDESPCLLIREPSFDLLAHVEVVLNIL